ncbi:MAG: hypothetical protein AAF846_25685 [Chloroflexota bacterium]
MRPAYSVSFMARATYNLHALNNEKSEGNKVLIRNVGLVVPSENSDEYELAKVNGISGNMFRYIYSGHLANVAQDMSLKISKACIQHHPERIWADTEFQDFLKDKPTTDEIYDQVLGCTVTDICGMMALDSSIQIKRHSMLHAGWISGLPHITKSEFHQFLRAEPNDQSLKPMPFTKTTASGVYAIAVQAEIPRIGYNDKRQAYPNNEKISVNRQGRFKALLLALAYSVLQPLGASLASQLPHVIGVEGLFIVSSLHTKAPLVSPLMNDYRMRAEKQRILISQLFDQPESMTSYPFETGEEMLEQVLEIANYFEPAKYYESDR